MTTRRGPYAKTAERRAGIAQAALDVVIERGHRELTTAAVAERAGISERTMQYHFPTRDHLLVAALELSDQRTASSGADMGQLLSEGISAVPRYVLGRGAREPRLMHLFSSLSAEADNPDHPANEYFRGRYDATVGIFARMVAEQQRVGAAHPDLDPMSVARQLLAVWSGLQSQWLVNPSFDLGSEVADAFRRLTGESAMEARQALSALVDRL